MDNEVFEETSSGAALMKKHGYVYFSEDITYKTTKPVIEYIIGENLKENDNRLDHITLIINSPGGEVPPCMALIDTMKGSGVPIWTIGVGEVCSCGLLAFMSGEHGHRILTPNTMILSHQYSWSSRGKEHELYARVEAFESYSKKILNLYKECTGLPVSRIKKELLKESDVWLSPEDAISFGMADEIRSMY